jgi:glycerophosphoryl diester phosphodiesterase
MPWWFSFVSRRVIKTLLLAVILALADATAAGEPLLVAHRGASREAPENTVPAYKLAWQQGADAIEGDFRLTKDGQIVCCHDPDTGRVADRKLVVADSSLADLRRLDVGAKAGRKFRNTVMPTLAEVLATVPVGKSVYLELKSGAAIIPGLLAEINRSGLKREQVVVIAFDAELIRAFKQAAPQFKALWLTSLKSGSGAESATPSADTILATLARCRADGFSSSAQGVTKDLLAAVAGAGYEYHVWTVDDPKEAKAFAGLGVRSITTNVPGPLREGMR